MRTVLIGSDFMYDKDGNLKLIEINTAVGWDGIEKVEDNEDCLDLTTLNEFITSNAFTTLHYIGDIGYLHKTLETHYSGSSVTYTFHGVGKEAITVPFIEDNDETLIIRSSYDTTALVDDTYCKDKVNFMKLIQSQSFGSQFAYLDESNQLVSNITTITDNGIHPNFVLKSVLPAYDKEVYPKFFKVSNQTELEEVISTNVSSDYFLMECHINTNKTWEGHSVVIRSLNILFPPNLESIQIGQYTKLNQNILLDNVTYDSTTHIVNENFRESYLTNPISNAEPKLLDTDMVEMSDGSYKTALELQIGDVIKTIDFPNTDNNYVTLRNSENLGDFASIVSGTTYSTNIVINKKKVNRLSAIKELTFTDNTNWEDTIGSQYLIEKSDGVIKFERIDELQPGDVVLLLDTTDSNVNFIRKTISTTQEVRRVFSGWFITVENAHIFLTKTTSTNNQSYVSIEHNVVSCPEETCGVGCNQCVSCPKQESYCWDGICSDYCPS